MYTSKIIDDKDTGIYLQGKLVCILPTSEADLALQIKNDWLEKDRAGYRNYGYQNDWGTVSIKVKACIDAAHEVTDYSPAGYESGEHKVYCDLCRITWKYDTSDQAKR